MNDRGIPSPTDACFLGPECLFVQAAFEASAAGVKLLSLRVVR